MSLTYHDGDGDQDGDDDGNDYSDGDSDSENGDVSDLFGRVKALEKMAAKVPVLEETLKKLQAKFDELEKRFTLHLSHPEIGNAADDDYDDGYSEFNGKKILRRC